MSMKHIVGLLLVAVVAVNSSPITTLDTAYIGLQKDIKMPEGLDVKGLVMVDGPSTFAGTGDAKVVKTIALESSKMKAKKANALDTQARRIRSPNGKLDVQGTIQVAGAIRYAEPKTTDFPASPFAFVEEAESEVKGDGPSNKYWKRVAKEDFSGEEGLDGWKSLLLRGSSVGGDAAEATVGKSKCVGNHFLGGHCKASSHTLSKIFDSLPPHTEVRVKARFHFIDKWNGENAYLKVDGGYAWLASHKTAKGKGVHMCGSDDVKESKFGVPIDIMETHSASKLELKFGSELNVDPCVGSFGVDDIEIFVR